MAAASLALVALHLGLMFASLAQAKKHVEANQKMRKLATLTIQNFPDRLHLTHESFWTALGRTGSPMLDPWGSAFQLEARGKNSFAWHSSGADRQHGTGDDLEMQVPFASGPAESDIGFPEAPMGAPVIDAK